MFAREENNSLDGICAGCNAKQPMRAQEEWHLNRLYKVLTCNGCGYEHTLLVKKA